MGTQALSLYNCNDMNVEIQYISLYIPSIAHTHQYFPAKALSVQPLTLG